jgi:hypothetical protein
MYTFNYSVNAMSSLRKGVINLCPLVSLLLLWLINLTFTLSGPAYDRAWFSGSDKQEILNFDIDFDSLKN